MSHVVTLIAAPGTVLNVAPFVTALGQPRKQVWLEEPRALDLYYPAAADLAHARILAEQAGVDVIVQPVATREKKLLIADMDSTMIAQECIDEMADCLGLKPKISAITERAMRGEIDFPSALRERVSLLRGLEESTLQEVFDTRITLTPGAKVLVATMNARGCHCVLVSGGFTFFTSRVARAIGFASDEANTLTIENGKLTGKVGELILDKDSKRASLHRLVKEKNILLEQTVAIGDGANDIPMLKDAGLGIAYHAKPVVVEQAAAAIHYNDLTAVLFALGISKAEWISA